MEPEDQDRMERAAIMIEQLNAENNRLASALRGLIRGVEQTRVYAFSKGSAFEPWLSKARACFANDAGADHG